MSELRTYSTFTQEAGIMRAHSAKHTLSTNCSVVLCNVIYYESHSFSHERSLQDQLLNNRHWKERLHFVQSRSDHWRHKAPIHSICSISVADLITGCQEIQYNNIFWICVAFNFFIVSPSLLPSCHSHTHKTYSNTPIQRAKTSFKALKPCFPHSSCSLM